MAGQNQFQSFSFSQNALATKNADYTLTVNDGTIVGVTPASAAYTLTIPLAASMSGQIFKIKMGYNDLSKNITIARTSSDVFSYNGTTATSLTMFTLDEEYEIQSGGGTTWYVITHKTTTKQLTYTAIASGNGFGTPASQTSYWWRVGNRLFARGHAVMGTVAASSCPVALPSGLAIDTSSEVTGTQVQHVGIYWDGTTSGTPVINGTQVGLLMYDGSDTANVYVSYRSVSVTFQKNTGVNAFVGNGDLFSFDFSVPISGWLA